MTQRPQLFEQPDLADIGIEWDDTPCPLCGERDEELRFEAADSTGSSGERGRRFLVVRCRRCRLSFTNPRPGPESIGQFYPADYQPHRRPAKLVHSNPRGRLRERFLGRPCRERRGLLPWDGVGRLLDFGCGGGSFLKRMADQGWDVTGLDANVGAVQSVQEELGLNAVVGTLPHGDLRPGSFEIVTLWHSIEHVHDPLEILREAYRLLVPGGKVILACPNIGSWAFRHFRVDWFGLDLPRHLTHFTSDSLTAMLETAGFRVESLRTLRHSDWLRSSAKLSVRFGRAGFFDRLLTWKPLAKFVGWFVYIMGSSDCLIAVAERPKV